MQPGHPVQIASIAQKMTKMLFLDCPANYNCGGPAFAALASMDAILTLMGVGITMIQRSGGGTSEEYQKFVKASAVEGSGILSTYVQHKSQILAGALHAVLCDLKTQKTRECREVTENALLAAIQWFLKKTQTDPKVFIEKILASDHDELEQLEKDLRRPKEEVA